MKQTLDEFILAIPVLFIKQFPYAWISSLQCEHAFKDGNFYVNQPPFSWMSTAGRILILMAGAGLLAWLLRGQFGLSFWQVFLILFGFTLLYRDTQFFGAPTTYVITDQGIGIHFVPGHIDYRLFLTFKEIGRLKKGDIKKTRTGMHSCATGTRRRVS